MKFIRRRQERLGQKTKPASPACHLIGLGMPNSFLSNRDIPQLQKLRLVPRLREKLLRQSNLHPPRSNLNREEYQFSNIAKKYNSARHLGHRAPIGRASLQCPDAASARSCCRHQAVRPLAIGVHALPAPLSAGGSFGHGIADRQGCGYRLRLQSSRALYKGRAKLTSASPNSVAALSDLPPAQSGRWGDF